MILLTAPLSGVLFDMIGAYWLFVLALAGNLLGWGILWVSPRQPHVTRDAKKPSGVALIFVARDGENSIAVAPGANHNMTAADVRRAAVRIKQAAVVLMQLEIPLAAVQAAGLLFACAKARSLATTAR